MSATKYQNNYKEISSMMGMAKRGQVAIFVIVAIVIVVAGILVYFLVPGVRSAISGEIVPSDFFRSCVDDSLQENIQLLASQGGYANPEGYILHNGNRVKYLCYTSQYYFPCKVQQPLVKRNFEMELEKVLDDEAGRCVGELREEYEGRGFDVRGGEDVAINVEIAPDKIIVSTETSITASRDETTINFRSIRFEEESQMYDLVLISTSIVDLEATYGDIETNLYYDYYPNIVIEKNKLSDGTTVYGVEDVTTGEKFNFASRSLAWPGGYGLDG